MKEFKAALAKRINQKQSQYNVLLQNLSTAALPPEILSDIGKQICRISKQKSPPWKPQSRLRTSLLTKSAFGWNL